MKIGVLILYFNASRTILSCIENCSQFADIIYISYSKEPWSKYNPNARANHQNTSALSIIRTSKHFGKIKIIEGVWATEEEQRNEVVASAKADQIDYLIIQDPDEFYLPEDYKMNIDEMIQKPGFPFFYNPWIIFWRNLNYIVAILAQPGDCAPRFQFSF
ncbi:MAG: hypothetical protein ACHQFW_11470 [Chitinophagales bacterium]